MNSIHVQIWRLKVSNIQVGGNTASGRPRVLCLIAAPQSPLQLWSHLACVPQFLFAQKATLLLETHPTPV